MAHDILINFQLKMARETEELAEAEDTGGLRLYVETKNIRARKTYEALSMSSEHYAFYQWMRK